MKLSLRSFYTTCLIFAQIGLESKNNLVTLISIGSKPLELYSVFTAVTSE